MICQRYKRANGVSRDLLLKTLHLEQPHTVSKDKECIHSHWHAWEWPCSSFYQTKSVTITWLTSCWPVSVFDVSVKHIISCRGVIRECLFGVNLWSIGVVRLNVLAQVWQHVKWTDGALWPMALKTAASFKSGDRCCTCKTLLTLHSHRSVNRAGRLVTQLDKTMRGKYGECLQTCKCVVYLLQTFSCMVAEQEIPHCVKGFCFFFKLHYHLI